MFISFITVATASLLPLVVNVAPSIHGYSASLPSHSTSENQQSIQSTPEGIEFFHRGSGRCELPNCV